MQRTGKINIALVMAILLLCLVLITTAIVSGFLAKFATSDSNNDTSRVAKFEITGSGFNKTLNLGVTMNPGDEHEYSNVGNGGILIRNKSEVSVRCVVKLRNTTKNLPLNLMLKDGSDAYTDNQTTAFNSPTGYEYTVDLAPNSEEKAFPFKLTWPNTPEANRNIIYSGMLDNIAVTVTATQID